MGRDRITPDPELLIEEAAAAAGKAAYAVLQDQLPNEQLERIVIIVETGQGQGATTYNPRLDKTSATPEEMEQEGMEMALSMMLMLKFTLQAMGKEMLIVPTSFGSSN